MELSNKISEIKKLFEKDLSDLNKSLTHDEIYLKYFSKSKGLVTELIKMLPSLVPEDKKTFGTKINELSNEIKEKLETAKKDRKSVV